MPLSFAWLTIGFALISVLGASPGVRSAEARPESQRIEFHTIPDLSGVRPLQDQVSMTVTFKDGSGSALRDIRAQIELEAPRPGRFFSTDFPAVEGSRLLEMELSAPAGQIRWDYVFPIRGKYRLRVRTLGPQKPLAEETFTFGVGENPRRLLYLGIFAGGLFLLGFLGGRVVMLVALVVLCMVTMAAEAATSQKAETHGPQLEIDPASTEQPTEILWRARERGDSIPARLSLAIESLEKKKVIFALENVPTDGRFSMKFHFADGSPHRVKAVATTAGGRTFTAEETVPVTAADPPLAVRLRTWFYFLLIVALGWAAGRVSRRRRAKVS